MVQIIDFEAKDLPMTLRRPRRTYDIIDILTVRPPSELTQARRKEMSEIGQNRDNESSAEKMGTLDAWGKRMLLQRLPCEHKINRISSTRRSRVGNEVDSAKTKPTECDIVLL
uniref:Uncharacterized protein n=1 Tax=Plectus sambesii TaxID=2011161 RepID=A0A914WIH8_9BILA